jgi:hypothetical protein
MHSVALFLALFFLALVFGIFVAGRALTLLHELEHGVAAVLLTSGRVTVAQGHDPPLLLFGLGRLDVRLRPVTGPRFAFYGYYEYGEDGLSRGRSVVILAAVPVVSLLTAGVGSAIAIAASGIGAWFAWVVVVVAVNGFLVTAIPMRYGRLFGPMQAGRATASPFFSCFAHFEPA